MTDESLVINFIASNYELAFSDDNILVVKKGISKNRLNPSGFYSVIYLIFGEWMDAYIQPDNIAKKWYEITSKAALYELDSFLNEHKTDVNDLELVLVSSDGAILNLEKLVTLFEPKINRDFVGAYFTKWFNSKKKELTKKYVHGELKNYDVRLGLTDWFTINPEGKIITEKILFEKYPWADNTTIDKIYTKWKEDKIIDVSSKMMGITD